MSRSKQHFICIKIVRLPVKGRPASVFLLFLHRILHQRAAPMKKLYLSNCDLDYVQVLMLADRHCRGTEKNQVLKSGDQKPL
jgi:hypothetical protein